MSSSGWCSLLDPDILSEMDDRLIRESFCCEIELWQVEGLIDFFDADLVTAPEQKLWDLK